MGFGSGGGSRSVFVCPLEGTLDDGGAIEGVRGGFGNFDGAFGNFEGVFGAFDGAFGNFDGGAGGRTVVRPSRAVFPFSSSFFAAIGD